MGRWGCGVRSQQTPAPNLSAGQIVHRTGGLATARTLKPSRPKIHRKNIGMADPTESEGGGEGVECRDSQ